MSETIRFAQSRIIGHDTFGCRCTTYSRFDLEQGGLLHDAEELFLVDFIVTVTIGFINHFLEFVIRHVLTQFFGDALQVLERNLASLIVIEEAESLHDFLARVALAHLSGHHGEELFEIDGAVAILVDVSNHFLDFVLVRFKSESAHGNLEFLGINGTRTVGVKQVERFANLLLLLLRETRGAPFTLSTCGTSL